MSKSTRKCYPYTFSNKMIGTTNYKTMKFLFIRYVWPRVLKITPQTHINAISVNTAEKVICHQCENQSDS